MNEVEIIELDGKNWQSILDFYDALRTVLGSPDWHGAGIDAMIDSMIWGEINEVEPPYTVRLVNTRQLPKEIRDEIELLKQELETARLDHRDREGRDVQANFEIAS